MVTQAQSLAVLSVWNSVTIFKMFPQIFEAIFRLPSKKKIKRLGIEYNSFSRRFIFK